MLSVNTYPYEIHMYSAKIGNYVRTNELGYFNLQTKYIITLPKDALEELGLIMDGFAPELGFDGKNDLKCTGDRYGVDVYTGVTSIHPYQEQSVSSGQYTENAMESDEGKKWLKHQKKAFKREDSYLSEEQLEQKMRFIKDQFKEVIRHLRNQKKPDHTVTIRRQSGTRHKIQIKPNTKTKRVTYSNVLIAVSSDHHLPKVVEQKKKQRKTRAGSIKDQHKTNEDVFSHYSEFGIFEVYDKK